MIAVLFALIPLTISFIFAPRKFSVVKREGYECGFKPVDNARKPISVRFFVMAILFLIFDVETVFFFPWAVSLRSVGWLGFFVMLFFIVILAIGFVYEWLVGALEWK